MTYLAGMKVEIFAVKLVALGKVGDTHAKVTQLVDWCRAFLETLEFVGAAVFLVGLYIMVSRYSSCG